MSAELGVALRKEARANFLEPRIASLELEGKGAKPSHTQVAQYLNCGVSYQTIGRIRRGKRVSRSSLEALCNKLDFKDWQEYLQEESDHPASLQHNPAVIAQLPETIRQKLGSFVGREHVFNSFKDFCQRNPRGFFTLIGDPGEGKSMIAAEFIRRHGIENQYPLFFFIQYQIQNNTPRKFHQSLCRQVFQRFPRLEERYKLVPNDCGQSDGMFLSQLLNDPDLTVSQQSPLFIAIDALDEVDDLTVGRGNILYLPTSLPNHVYFFLTRRRRFERQLVFKDHAGFYDLLQHAAECREDVAEYIDDYWEDPAKNENIRAWATSQNLDQDAFIDLLVDRSQNNFMYLFFVLNDMAAGVYKSVSLRDIPRGLMNYYHEHWIRMGMNERPTPLLKFNILSRLTETEMPVSAELLREFASYGIDKQVSIEEVLAALEDWLQFLHIIRENKTDRYFPYHLSFYDFLHDDPQIEEKRRELIAYRKNTTMSDVLLDGLDD